MSKAQIYLTNCLKDPSINGGYYRVGDGNNQTTMYITKGGVSLELDTEDVKALMVSLQSINPTIYIT